jgi:serine/threonine protein kinase
VRELSIGDIFAGHRLEAVLGRGGMGIVYLAMHERLKQRRALKVISPAFSSDEQFRRRFERESEVAASLEHAHVIPIYDAGEDEDQLYIAMRYIEGTDMHELIGERGSVDPSSTSLIVKQMASALDAAHARGLVHRDVKPANVLIASRSGADYSYLTDFGLTKVAGKELSKLTATGTILGTLDYVAPEQLDGVAIPASDVYSLGCLTFHALSGEVPYPQPGAAAKMWAHINAPPPRLEDGPARASEVVACAMAKDPGSRFSTAGDFARALAETLEEPVARIQDRDEQDDQIASRTRRRRDADRNRRERGGELLEVADSSGGESPHSHSKRSHQADVRARIRRAAGRHPRVIAGALLLVFLAVSLAFWRALDNGSGDRAPVDEARSPQAPSGPPHATAADVARVKRVVLEIGGTTSREKTCRLLTKHAKATLFGDPSRCPVTSEPPTVVHYRNLKVALHGPRATVEATGKYGRDELQLVKSPGGSWLVDQVSRWDVDRVKRLVLLYGRSTDPETLCHIISARRIAKKYGDYATCISRTRREALAAHYRILSLALRGRDATVEVAGEVTPASGRKRFREIIRIVKSDSGAWLVDEIVKLNPRVGTGRPA